MKKLKWMKMSGILFLAMTLACTAAVAVDKGQSAAAKTVKAKKLTMKKKKVSVTVGKTVKLGVSVKPKKATIKWSSNKKKVATVNKKGVVKGIKKGTAKITAKSGKKKAVCTVNVRAKAVPANMPVAELGPKIQSVEVITNKIIRVQLTKALSLNKSDFSVKKKGTGKGAYNTALNLGEVVKQSDLTYELVLSTDAKIGESGQIEDPNTIEEGDYVQVTVGKLDDGLKAQETVYYPTTYSQDIYRRLLVGEKFEEGFYFSQSRKGYVSGIQVSGVPSGLTAKVYGDAVLVEGVPDEAKASVMTFTGKDELGKQLTQKVNFYIGSSDVMLSYIESGRQTILANDNYTENFEIYTIGGSGDYTCSIQGNTNPLISIEDDSIFFHAFTVDETTGAKTYLNPGSYSISYTVEDGAGHTNTGKLDVTAVNGVMVSGKVTMADDTGIDRTDVGAHISNETRDYYRRGFYTDTYEEGDIDNFGTAEKKTGEYNMVVYPSERYDFNANKGDLTVSVKSKKIGTSDVKLDFKMPLYKVTLTSDDDLDDLEWENTQGDFIGWGDTLYLQKGAYTLRAFVGEIYEYVASFTVNGNCTVNVTKKNTVSTSGAFTEETPLQISTLPGYRTKYYAFTPSATGTYYFVCEKDDDSYLDIYFRDGETGNWIDSFVDEYIYETDEDGVEHEYIVFSMRADVTAGKTYYLQLGSEDDIHDITITAEKIEE